MKEPEKAPAKAPEKAQPVSEPEKVEEKKAEAPADAKLEPPTDRKALDAMVKEYGVDAAVGQLAKVKVVDLRALAREYNGEFGIAGREIRNANKKVLIDEFRKFFTE